MKLAADTGANPATIEKANVLETQAQAQVNAAPEAIT